MVRVESPAAAAISSPLVAETPRSQNSAQAWRETARRACACFGLCVPRISWVAMVKASYTQ